MLIYLIMKQNKLFLLLACICYFFISFISNVHGKNIIDNEVTISSTITIRSSENISMRVTSLSEVSSENILQRTVAIVLRLEAFLDALGLDEDICKDLDLVIYYIPYDVLNDRDIMNFLNWNMWNNLNVTGIYVTDSIKSPRNEGTIYISNDLSDRLLNKTIGHELVHFWQDRNCILSGDTESLATQFENL